MSLMRCDTCDRRIDTDTDVEGVYDEQLDVFACSHCCARWQETVTGTKSPATKPNEGVEK